MAERSASRPLQAHSARTARPWLGALLAALLLAGAAGAAPPPLPPGLETELRRVTERNLLAAEEEDLELYAATLHPASPHYAPTVEMLGPHFEAYDLRYRLLEFTLVAFDGEYTYARVEQETRKRAGAEFLDNVAEQLWVYRPHGDTWKVWGTTLLEFDPFAPPLVGGNPDDAALRSDFPMLSIVLSFAGITPVECDELPAPPGPNAGAARFCGDHAHIPFPLPEDDLFLEMLELTAQRVGAWTEVAAGHRITFTHRGAEYRLTYRHDGHTVIDATR